MGSHLGRLQGSFRGCPSTPKALQRASVQSPAARMCTLKKSSWGAEVRVKGCHSSVDMDGHWINTYCPGAILKSRFFMQSYWGVNMASTAALFDSSFVAAFHSFQLKTGYSTKEHSNFLPLVHLSPQSFSRTKNRIPTAGAKLQNQRERND